MSGQARRWLLSLLLLFLCGGFGGSGVSAQRMPRPGELWEAPDVDRDAPPPIANAAPCSLPDVLEQAGKRVEELVGNLDRFTATEYVEHESVDRTGRLGNVQTRRFDYAVTIASRAGGYLGVQEFRSRVANAEQFPDGVSTEGTPSQVLIFHPLYARDFDMTCEGLGEWQGQPAWQVRFEQRADRTNRLSNVVMDNKLYSLRLRGRAWILADSYQVARLETDLAAPIPALRLNVEHMSLEYRPVAFPERQTELWLPAGVEMYVDFAGREFYRRHTFSNFTLFSVDVDQQIAKPPDAAPPR